MNIHIMGASCAGSTTLGNALASRSGYPYFDTDQYFWEPATIPFTVRRNAEIRNTMLKTDMEKSENAIVGGSVIDWGPEWPGMFDLVVFLYVPHQIRMDRLKSRESERYGDQIFTDPERAAGYGRYTAWASGYDDNTTRGRNLKAHRDWLMKLTCPVLEIHGDTSIDERLNLVIAKVDELQKLSIGPAS